MQVPSYWILWKILSALELDTLHLFIKKKDVKFIDYIDT